MDVTEAVSTRSTIRAFTDDPLPEDTLRELLTKAARAPSGGNLQPWKVYAVTGDAMTRFRAHVAEAAPFDAPQYEIYPPDMWEPHRTSRFRGGEALYDTLGIGRDDKAGRAEQFARNGDAFGAPAIVFCYIDKRMGLPQWSDLGMFLQTFMLLATEAGLATCPQEYWSVRNAAVASFVDAPDELMLFCGVAIGTGDPDAVVNTLVTERLPLEEWATFLL